VNRMVSFSAASKDFQSGNYVRSLETLNTLLETQQDAKTYALLGRTLAQLGMKADAAMAYSLAGDKAGESGAEFSRKAAILHFEVGNEDNALRLGLRHMMNQSLDAEIAYVLGSIYLKRNQHDLLTPFIKVLAESSNMDHTMLAVRMLRNNPSDQSQAFLTRSLFKRFPKLIQFRLLYLVFSRDVCDLNAVTLHKPVVDGLLEKGETAFLKYETEFYNLQWNGDEALNRRAGSLNTLTQEQVDKRRAVPHQWSEKIRIGYLSSDFFEHHATMKLIGRVLELHDSSRFDVTLYCHTNPKNLATNTFDRSRWGRIVELEGVSDAEAAAKMRQDGIDILVDLKGPTFETRYQILNHGGAPVQMSWIGYPGSTRNTDLDYVIGDRFVLPDTSKPNYHEKFVHLPDTYQPNDPVGRPKPEPVTRAQYGLPDDKFVFASFNAGRKITPEAVDVWCNILRRAPDSVLWMLAASKASEANLREYFKKQGIPTKRVVFCGHADYQCRRFPKERTRLPTSRFQPSIRTKNRILNGSEIDVGGSIIMPIAMVMVATIRSMTRKGSTIRKPISKPRRISEIMKAGTRMRRSTSRGSTVWPRSRARSANSEVLVAGVAGHEGAERIGNALEGLLSR
jgi:predicted O-linked N-acetylglucosamine transferase (SPINDLY family)